MAEEDWGDASVQVEVPTISDDAANGVGGAWDEIPPEYLPDEPEADAEQAEEEYVAPEPEKDA